MNAKVLAAVVALSAMFAMLSAQSQIDNCCFVDRECRSGWDWTRGWKDFRNGQCSEQTQSVASGATNIDNCCFVDRQCNTDQEWTDGWHAFQNGQCAAPAQAQPQFQPQTQTAARPEVADMEMIDNCCYLDRECHSEEEWNAGWMAFKALECWDEYREWWTSPDPRYMPASGSNNCCTAPGWVCLTDKHFDAGYRAYLSENHCAPRVKYSFMPYHKHIYTTDNCCDLGRECHSDADWQRGYSDFRFFRCAIHVPLVNNLPVSLEGNQVFIDVWRAAFSLLKAQSPRFYDYAISGLDAIKEYSDGDPNRGGCHVICGSVNTAYCEWIEHFNYIDHELIAVTASVIVHEACHCHRQAKGYHANNFWENEVPCHKAQADLMKELDPGNSFGIPWEDYRANARERGVTDLRY